MKHPLSFRLGFSSTILLMLFGLWMNTSSLEAQTTPDTRGIEKYLNLGENQHAYVVIRPTVKSASLKEITRDFEKLGIGIDFRKVQYNEQNMLTRMVMEVSIGDCQSPEQECYEWKEEAYNDGQALDPEKPLVFYLYQQGQQVEHIGTSMGYPTVLSQEKVSFLKNINGSIVGTFNLDQSPIAEVHEPPARDIPTLPDKRWVGQELAREFTQLMVKEKLISDTENYSYRLSSKELLINDVKQSEKWFSSFVRIYESVAKEQLDGEVVISSYRKDGKGNFDYSF